MEIDWMVGLRCPERKEGEDRLEQCMKCPNAIWDSATVAGLLDSGMCNVFLGKSSVATELNSIARKLTGIESFSTKESSPADKIAALNRILKYAKETGWSLEGRSADDTEGHLEMLIEFCKRAEKKDLDIFAGW
jgi:hypothetical protein